MFSDITSGCKKICIASTDLLILTNRIYKFKKKLLFIKLPTSIIFFVWLNSFTWVAFASSYSLNCTYHRCLFISRWQAKCCIVIVLHLFMNISYGAYSMLCCTEMSLFNVCFWKWRFSGAFKVTQLFCYDDTFTTIKAWSFQRVCEIL